MVKALALLLIAVAIAVMISAVNAGLEKTGTKDDAGDLVQVVVDGTSRGVRSLWPDGE